MHVPMALAMILFVGSQPKDINGNPSENFVGAYQWYWLAFSQHIALALVHYSTFFMIGGLYIILEAFKVMAILAEVLNFIMAMILFINAPPHDQISEDEQTFKIWLMLEILCVVSLIVTNCIYTIFRSFERNKIELSIEDNDDKTLDYLAAESTQLLITMFTIPAWPIFTNILLELYIGIIRERSGRVWNEEKGNEIN